MTISTTNQFAINNKKKLHIQPSIQHGVECCKIVAFQSSTALQHKSSSSLSPITRYVIRKKGHRRKQTSNISLPSKLSRTKSTVTFFRKSTSRSHGTLRVLMFSAEESVAQSLRLPLCCESQKQSGQTQSEGITPEEDYVFDSLPIRAKWPMRGQLRQDRRARRCVGMVSMCALWFQRRHLTGHRQHWARQSGETRSISTSVKRVVSKGRRKGVGGFRQRIQHVSLPQCLLTCKIQYNLIGLFYLPSFSCLNSIPQRLSGTWETEKNNTDLYWHKAKIIFC